MFQKLLVLIAIAIFSIAIISCGSSKPEVDENCIQLPGTPLSPECAKKV